MIGPKLSSIAKQISIDATYQNSEWAGAEYSVGKRERSVIAAWSKYWITQDDAFLGECWVHSSSSCLFLYQEHDEQQGSGVPRSSRLLL